MAVVLVALAVAASGVASARAASTPSVSSTTSTPSTQSTRPKVAKPPAEWDRQIGPIAHEVESIRGLTFDHPVAVEYLDDAAFRARLKAEGGTETKRDKADEQRMEAQLRAAGLIEADVDLGAAADDFEAAGVLAYYDPDTKSVTVRGKKLDVMTKVTLAHELTHALDDQHFDLNAMDRAAHKAHADSTLTALLEGDAVRVEDEYTSRLSAADRDKEAASEQDAGASVNGEIDTADVPAAVQVFLGSPYVMGVQMVKLAAEEGGNATVDGLFRDPPRSELAFVDVSTVAKGDHPLAVPPPVVEPGEQRSGPRDSFGTFALYLMLSTALDPVDALEAVRGWGGDAMITVMRGDETCVRANFTGRDPQASTKLADALQRWSTSGAHPSARVTTAGPITTLVTCDSDAPTTDPVGPLTAAEATVALRNDLLLETIQAGLGKTVAECTADGVIHSSAFAALRDAQVSAPGAQPSADVVQPLQRVVQRTVTDCRSGSI